MTAVTDITPIAHITCPSALRDLPGWLIWRFEPNENPGGKARKVPYYASGGRRHGEVGTSEDRAKLTTFDAARAAAARRGFDGVGFATLPDFDVVALDFDDCLANGQIHPEVLATLSDTYAEFSPSGQGIRAFFKGQLGNRKSHKRNGLPFGFETFSTKGYVTFTGQVLDIVRLMGNEDEVAPVSEAVTDLVRRRWRRELELSAGPAEENPDALGMGLAQLEQCLAGIDPTELPYEDSDGPSWFGVGCAVHHETGGSADGFELWDAWSQRSPKYTSRDYGADRWRSMGRYTGASITARSLMRWAGVDPSAPASAADFEAVKQEAASPDKPAKAKRFTPVSFWDFAERPAPEWIIKGVLPRAGLAVLYGESGSGKSFMALDMGMAIARGIEWRGRRVRQGRVVVIAAEGAGGFRNRCVAYAQQHGLDRGSDLPFEVIADQPNLLQKEDALAVARGIGRADVVIVDTFAQTTPGGNENAGEDMGKALAHCAGIHRATGALVVLVHHSGKDASRGARGWSGIKAAADAELEVSKGPGGRMLRTSKMKDGDDGLAWGFGLELVTLGLDADGDPITSCVVVEAQLPTAKVLRPMGVVEQVVNAVVQEMAQAQTSGIEVEAVLKEAIQRMSAPEDGKRDTRRMRARRALLALCEGDDAPYFEEDGCLTVV